MKEAPLFVDAYDLHSWLLDRFEAKPIAKRVGDEVLTHSARLLDSIALAVARFETVERLLEADSETTLLRVHLRLAAEKGLLDDRQLLHANRKLRAIGRQIGGWSKKLRE